ncbi:MAG: hypothetical protein KHZ78_07795 [Peptoniphilus sp. oral taxon 375]|nr:hypothetical protein [Peptoniphilus sp. oral taxon 375]
MKSCTSPTRNSESVYLGVMGIDIIPCINIILTIQATRGRPYKLADGL